MSDKLHRTSCDNYSRHKNRKPLWTDRAQHPIAFSYGVYPRFDSSYAFLCLMELSSFDVHHDLDHRVHPGHSFD